MNKEKAFNIGLPKWCQMVIEGDNITKEQAIEIIKRTDTFFIGECFGNNRSYIKEAKRLFDIKDMSDFEKEDFNVRIEKYFKNKEELILRWNSIELTHLVNRWISNSWIGGANGWCHPNGEIKYCDNIGKYPDVEEVYSDLEKLAAAFPFLNMTVTLMDGERDYCHNSLVSMKVSNGIVEFVDTIPKDSLNCNSVPLEFFAKENYFTIDEMKKLFL